MNYNSPEFINKRFNRLLILSIYSKDCKKRTRVYCLCKCDCGSEVEIVFEHVKNETTKSCGCLWREKITTHNLSRKGLKEYGAWRRMKIRCKENFKGRKYYFDRGITVCDEWESSFETFYTDMGNAPSPTHSLDRKDGTKGYYKDNCRWATKAEQSRNLSSNRYFEFGGQIKCLADWSKFTGLTKSTLRIRLKLGWSIEDMLTKPVQRKRA